MVSRYWDFIFILALIHARKRYTSSKSKLQRTETSYAEQQAEQSRKQTVENFDDGTDILGDTPLNHFENAEVEELLEGVEEEENALDSAFEAFFTDEDIK